MAPKKDQSAYSRPETVGELIDRLKQFPRDYELSFSGLSLFQIRDRGEVCAFEFNEIEGDTGRVMEQPPNDRRR